ncbi:hypothetical protein [Priestia megaterium]|uniref:hypothetical protein n=1 Tax=Priestia megaterium TaxID=1404 RepID=UPI003C2CE6F2
MGKFSEHEYKKKTGELYTEGKIAIDCSWSYNGSSDGPSADLIYSGLLLKDNDDDKEIEQIYTGVDNYEEDMEQAISKVNAMGLNWYPTNDLSEYDAWYLEKWDKSFL